MEPHRLSLPVAGLVAGRSPGVALLCALCCLACAGVAEPEPPSEAADVKLICTAWVESECANEDACTDAELDAGIHKAAVNTGWGKAMVEELVEGDEISDAARNKVVKKIIETNADRSSLDCIAVIVGSSLSGDPDAVDRGRPSDAPAE